MIILVIIGMTIGQVMYNQKVEKEKLIEKQKIEKVAEQKDDLK